jgi:hypothetical protein
MCVFRPFCRYLKLYLATTNPAGATAAATKQPLLSKISDHVVAEFAERAPSAIAFGSPGAKNKMVSHIAFPADGSNLYNLKTGYFLPGSRSRTYPSVGTSKGSNGEVLFCENLHLADAARTTIYKQVPPEPTSRCPRANKQVRPSSSRPACSVMVARLLPSRSGSSVRRRPPSCASLLL